MIAASGQGRGRSCTPLCSRSLFDSRPRTCQTYDREKRSNPHEPQFAQATQARSRDARAAHKGVHVGGSEVRWVSGADRRSGRSVKAGEERGSRKSPVLQSEGPGTQGRVGDSGATLPPVARMNACDQLSACPTPQPGVPRLHVHTPREENLSRVRCEAGRRGLRRLSVGVSPVRGGRSRAHPFLVEVAVLTTPGRNTGGDGAHFDL